MSDNRKLYISNLSPYTTIDRFNSFFSSFGEIEDFVMMKDKETGLARGFGFVTYKVCAKVVNNVNNEEK